MRINVPIEEYQNQIIRYFGLNEELKMNSHYAKSLTFQVTEDCNLKCSYCYQINKSKKVMPFDVAKRTIDCLFEDNYKIKNYYDSDSILALVLEFIGGEPFLEVELIDKILDYYLNQAYKHKSILAYRYMISISSNGTLYNEPKVQAFIKKWRSHLSLSITLDGCKELHDACRIFPDGSGSYDLAVEAAKKELEIDPRLSTKMTFAPENIDYIPQAIQGLIDVGYRVIYCNCVFEDVWKKEDATKFYFKLKTVADDLCKLDILPYISIFSLTCGQPYSNDDDRNFCGGTGLMLCVNPDGNFYPCQRYTEVSLGNEAEPYIIGNVYDGIGIKEEEIQKIKCLACITRTSQCEQKCIDCKIATECAWCSAYNYQVFGTPNKRATFICDMHKARVMANCYFWNKLFRLNDNENRFKLNLDDESCLKIIDEKELSLLRELESD